MVERLKGADALALLEENVGSVMGEIPINGKIAEVEFRVPVGEEATALQEDVVGFVLKIEAGGTEEHNLKHAVPAWTVINFWGHKLMVTHGVPISLKCSQIASCGPSGCRAAWPSSVSSPDSGPRA